MARCREQNCFVCTTYATVRITITTQQWVQLLRHLLFFVDLTTMADAEPPPIEAPPRDEELAAAAENEEEEEEEDESHEEAKDALFTVARQLSAARWSSGPLSS